MLFIFKQKVHNRRLPAHCTYFTSYTVTYFHKIIKKYKEFETVKNKERLVYLLGERPK